MMVLCPHNSCSPAPAEAAHLGLNGGQQRVAIWVAATRAAAAAGKDWASRMEDGMQPMRPLPPPPPHPLFVVIIGLVPLMHHGRRILRAR